MASVSRRRFKHKISTVSLMEGGTVETTLMQRVGVDNTIQVSVWQMIDNDGYEADQMERYVFDLSLEEVDNLITKLMQARVNGGSD